MYAVREALPLGRNGWWPVNELSYAAPRFVMRPFLILVWATAAFAQHPSVAHEASAAEMRDRLAIAQNASVVECDTEPPVTSHAACCVQQILDIDTAATAIAETAAASADITLAYGGEDPTGAGRVLILLAPHGTQSGWVTTYGVLLAASVEGPVRGLVLLVSVVHVDDGETISDHRAAWIGAFEAFGLEPE